MAFCALRLAVVMLLCRGVLPRGETSITNNKEGAENPGVSAPSIVSMLMVTS
jgi:hypothetical protein